VQGAQKAKEAMFDCGDCTPSANEQACVKSLVASSWQQSGHALCSSVDVFDLFGFQNPQS